MSYLKSDVEFYTPPEPGPVPIQTIVGNLSANENASNQQNVSPLYDDSYLKTTIENYNPIPIDCDSVHVVDVVGNLTYKPDYSLYNATIFNMAIGATVTIQTPDLFVGKSYTLRFNYSGAPATVNWFSNITWFNSTGLPPTLTQLTNSSDIFTIYRFDTDCYNLYYQLAVDAGGPPGVQGPQGLQGPQGNQGNQGFQGNQGPQGVQGHTGFQGNQGRTGLQGPQGFQGPQGLQGPQGRTGVQGRTGAQGSQGYKGNTGLQGSTGYQGNQGPEGLQGFGATGLQGNQGPTGPQGIDGIDGLQGNQGPQGLGSTGLQGNQGPTGPTGPQGNQGEYLYTIQNVSPSTASTVTLDKSLYSGTVISAGEGHTYTLELSNMTFGKTYLLKIEYAGSLTINWPVGLTWINYSNIVPTLTRQAGKTDSFIFFCTGTDTYEVHYQLNSVYDPTGISVDASAVVVDATAFSGNLTTSDTDVQTALETIDALIIPVDAATVTFTPFDTIAATNAQDAIEEVFDEINTTLSDDYVPFEGSTRDIEISGYIQLPTGITTLVDADETVAGTSGYALRVGAETVIKIEGTESSGTITPKIGLFGAAAVAKQSGAGETVGFTAGSGTAVNDDSTFTGNVGSSAYRINDIVKALKNLGVLAV